MLEVQRFLIENKDCPIGEFQALTETLGIKCNFHPTKPLVILNYCQLDSPKMHPIVMECRGLVLHTETYEVVAGAMKRFFNMGEAEEITGKFVWGDAVESRAKEDGSLMTLFNFEGEWMVKTRASWADQNIGENMPRWDELFFSLLPKDFCEYGIYDSTYVFEMCSMFNQVVRLYPEPKLFLLTVIENGNVEVSSEEADLIAKYTELKRPAKIDVSNEYAVREYITTLEQTDGTAEGLVLKDRNGLRIKCKSATYLAYSRLGNNGNVCSIKAIVPLILAGELDEAGCIFPRVLEVALPVKRLMKDLFEELLELLNEVKDIESQKEFAIYITKTNPSVFSSLLFTLKKNGNLTEQGLLDIWRNSEDLLIKVLSDRFDC